MKTSMFLTTTVFFVALSAYAKNPPMVITKMSDEAVKAIPAALVEDVDMETDSRSETSAKVTLVTVYTGPRDAPYTTYAKVFDLVPQKAGDYGTFKMFKIPFMMNEFPRQTKVQLAKDGASIYVGFNATYLDDYSGNGEPRYLRSRMVMKFRVAIPAAEGSIDKTADFSIRR